MQRSLGIIYRFRTGNEFIRPVHGWTVKAEITDIVALVKQNIEEIRQRRICARVKPNFHWEEIRRAIILLDLLWRAKGDIGLPSIRVPSFVPRTDSKMRVGICNALVYLIFECVFRGAGGWIAKLPKILNELIARIVGSQFQKSVSFVPGNNIGHVPLEPFLVALCKF